MASARTPLRQPQDPQATEEGDALAVSRRDASSTELAERDLRDLLPAIEPERQVSDWGRSERIEGLLDRTVVDFLHHLWFRCTVEGIENVPADGGALLVSNHSGALPPDAAMIVKAIKEEHSRPRPLHLTVEQGAARSEEHTSELQSHVNLVCRLL